ncbi:MAG: hypothetical protein M0R17_06900 [Candidatus Omnitrophica bacterium]|jgi:hypothetical protein|nr:hypothetical protein [Candidatus Omnitrophota bacterium]
MAINTSSDNILSINPELKISSNSKPASIKIDPAFKIENTIKPNINYELSNYQESTDRYKRFIDEIYPNVNLERQAAANQSGWGKVGNMFSQGVLGEILAQGVIGGVGGLLELPKAIIDEISGRDADFSNFMTRFADNIGEELQDKSPIFRYNPGKAFDWKDLGWYTSNGVSIFSTLGMLIPALGEAKAASYFSKALKGISELSALNKANKVRKTFIAASDIFNTEKYWQGLTHSALAMRNAENIRESAQAFNTIRDEAYSTLQDENEYQKILNSKIGQEFLAEGREPNKLELSNFIASKAAWKNYGMNAINVVFDAMQLAPIFNGFKINTRTSKLLESAKVKGAQADILGETIAKSKFNVSPFFKGAGLLFGEQVSEGAEELVNAISQEDANWYGKHLLSNTDDKDFGDRIHEYLRAPSSWEQAFWGFAGGVVFSGGSRAIGSAKEAINDIQDPHGTNVKINEIQNRYAKLALRADQINKVNKGINLNTGKQFIGTEEQIKQAKEDMINGVKTILGYDLGFNASKSGNIDLLLDMISHKGFKEKFISLGLANETTFDAELVDLKKNILDAEHTYKNVYNKIFTTTNKKPYLRDLIIQESINKKAEVAQTTKYKNRAIAKAAGLKNNNPAYDKLRDENKDKDFDGTLENIINSHVLANLEHEVSLEKDEQVKSVMSEKIKRFKEDIRLKDKDLGDKKAIGDFNSITDVIEAEVEAKLYGIFLDNNNSEYEAIVNTNTSIPIIDKKLKTELDKVYNTQFETFRVKTGENTKVDIKVDNSTTMDSKIKYIDDTITKLKTDNLDPFVEDKSPTKKLPADRLKAYIDVLEQRRSILANQKAAMVIDEQSETAVAGRNTALVKKLDDVIKEIGVVFEKKNIKIEFTGKRNANIANVIQSEIQALALNPMASSAFGRFIDMLHKENSLEGYLKMDLDSLRKIYNTQFNELINASVFEEFINETLIAAGYQIKTTEPSVSANKLQDIINNLNDFKTTINNDNTKSVTDFTSQNPLTGSVTDRANKLMTSIINNGTPLFKESSTHGTFFKFELIAAKYGKLFGSERLKEDFKFLKLAYNIIRNSKIGEEGQKRIYNSEATLKKLDINKIIEAYGISDEFHEVQISNINNLTPTGGEDVMSTFIYPIKSNRNDNGDQVINDEDIERISLLLNSLEENTQVIAHVNTKLPGQEGFSQNKNNPETIPIIIEAVSGDRRIPIASVSTLKGIHDGVKYRFNGNDWTDIIIKDSSTTNTKLEYVQRLMPLIQSYFNARKMNESEFAISKAYEELVDADIHGVLYDLLGREIDIKGKEAMRAFTHIARVLFFGQNTSGVTPIEFRRNDIIANVIRWKDKLTRDHIGATKLRETIGIDVDKVVESSIKYITSGTLVKSKNQDGTIKYRNLTVIDEASKIQFYTIQDNTQSTVLENTRDKNKIISKQGNTPAYTHSFFIGISTRNNKVIPVGVYNNTLNGKYISDENLNKIHAKINELLAVLGKTKFEGYSAYQRKDTANVERSQSAEKDIINQLKRILNIQHEETEHKNALIVDNHSIRFTIDNITYIYNYYSNIYNTERFENTTKITKSISKEDFEQQLGNLSLNVNYQYLGGKPYVDILGERHDSYEEYLVTNNIVTTDIGQVVDRKGNKISNFTLSQYDGVGGVPLMLNIDTSVLKINTSKTPSFTKFSSLYQLDDRYKFVFNILDTIISTGKINFNVQLNVVSKDRETGNLAMLKYSPSTKTITVYKTWLDLYNRDKVAASLALVHDTLHALNGTRSKEEQAKLIEQLTSFRNELLATDEYKALVEKEDKTEIDNKLISILNMKDVEELLTYGLTDIHFAKFLDSVKSVDGKITVSFWSKLKEIIRELAQSFGIGTKLDELNYIFEQFITGGEIVRNIDREALGEVSKRDETDDLIDELSGNENPDKSIVSFEGNPSFTRSEIDYEFKSIGILQSDKAKEIFEKGNKNNWDLKKILTELSVPKEQKELLLSLNINNREELISELINKYSFAIEIELGQQDREYKVVFDVNGVADIDSIEPEIEDTFESVYDDEGNYLGEKIVNSRIINEVELTRPTSEYDYLTAPGGTNYREYNILTPAIIPDIQSHAKFTKDLAGDSIPTNSIGWFRSDEKYQTTNKKIGELKRRHIENTPIYEKSITARRIIEMQSDLFQKGRNKQFLTNNNVEETYIIGESGEYLIKTRNNEWFIEYKDINDDGIVSSYEQRISKEEADKYFARGDISNTEKTYIPITEKDKQQNDFLQLLNKEGNWITFFIKSILQDSARRGFKKVLFPSGETAIKIEGSEELVNGINSLNTSIEKLKEAKINKTDVRVNISPYANITENIPVKYEDIDNQIEDLEKKKSKLKSDGLEKLEPVNTFYETRVGDILKKRYNSSKITDEYENDWWEVEIDEERDLDKIKFVSYSSEMNKELTGSPFELDEEINILNVLSNVYIEHVHDLFKGVKGKDIDKLAIRDTLIREFAKQIRLRRENGTLSPEQKELLGRVLINLRDNDKFWKLFRISLSNQFGYNINEEEDFIEDIELLEKSWDNTDIVTKDPLSTINDQVKNLINRTYEADPNSIIIEDGEVIWRSNNNTPTGFANTISYAAYGNKLMDLMRGSLTKEDMLKALFDYASNTNSIFAKSLYSIHKELSNNNELLNAWFTSFDKAIIESYRDLNKTVYNEDGEYTEINLIHGSRNSVEYHIANKWTNLIVSRGENGFYDKEWYDNFTKEYNNISVLSSKFTKLNGEIAAGIVNLYYLVGIDITIDNLFYEFRENQNTFVKTMIAPLRNITGTPGITKYENNKVPYIVSLQTKPKTIFNEFGNLLRLANKVKYFREDHFSFANLSVKNNLRYDANRPTFLSNIFKKLESDDTTIFNTLLDYTKVLSNQHSILLWGNQLLNDEIVKEGRGIFNYIVDDGIRKPISLNKENLNNIKLSGYDGAKDLNENIASEYSDLTKHDWPLKTLIYYFAGGKIVTKDNVSEKTTAVFPMLNPADRKNTRFFEAPIINLSFIDYLKLIAPSSTIDTLRDIPIFKAIYLNAVDELIAMNTAKQVLFKLDDEGRAIDDENFGFVLKDEYQNDVKSGQIFYHYKLSDGTKRYLTFTNDNGLYRLDTSKSGNIFDLNNLTITQGNKQTTFNSVFINDINFTRHLMLSKSLNSALHDPLIKDDPNSTFKVRLEQFVHRFITEQLNTANRDLSVYQSFLEKAYNKKENQGREEKSLLLKERDFRHAVAEYALNTYLFNIEQVRLFYGSVADYKSNIDLNKRGGQTIVNGISSVHKGIFYGATISDVKLKSKVYRHMINALIYQFNYDKKDISIPKLEKIYTEDELRDNEIIVNGKAKTLFKPEEKAIYELVSPYLANDSANAVSFITFNEFEKRISGFGMTMQYQAILNKIRNGEQLSREDTIRFASMQKNFYYSLDHNSDLQKMIPNQVKNAEVVLTPALIKDLELDTLNTVMTNLDIPQLNLISAEKIGSLYVATIADENGRIVDEKTLIEELTKAKRPYNYEGLRMQLEVSDSLYEESITMSRQFAKKIIENIPNSGVEYEIDGEKLSGHQLKNHYFKLLNSNIYQDACKTLLRFDVRVDKDGNIIGEIDYDTIVDILEREGIDRNLSKNIIYSLQIGDSGYSRLPLFFNTHSNKWENILTSLFTNGVTNQKFPGLKAAQMSGLFLNRKKGVKWSDLESVTGINWHKSIEIRSNINGKITHRTDISLRSRILHDSEDGIIQEAEVLLPRWAKEFYKDGEYIDINDISDEVRTMIGYRIPMEAKYSAYVFKVVGFLPDDNGPSIVLPDDFVTQTGSDFDMDTVYAFLYNLHTKTTFETRQVEVGPNNIIEKQIQTNVVERIPYIKENNAKALDARVKAIMENRSQLVHILSLELNNDELYEVVTLLNEVITNYFENKDPNAEINKKYKPQYDRIDALKARVKKVNKKERKIIFDEIAEIAAQIAGDDAFIFFKDRVEYINIEKQVRNIISKLSIDEQNTRKARENEILDLYYSILTNPYHYIETISTSNFKDITESKRKSDRELSISERKLNNLTFDGQHEYRNLSTEGRDLKGISLAADRFNSIAQIAGIHLTEKLKDDKKKVSSETTLPTIEYIVTSEQKQQLVENYGKDVRFEVRGVEDNKKTYAIVTHRFIGNNPNGTFKNVVGKLINTYSAQTTANILDNVAFPLPNNVNKYTVNIWKLLISLGSTYDVSTALINQPIIRDLTDFFFANTNSIKRGSEIEQTKRKFQTLLYKVLVKGGTKPREDWEKNINDNKPIWVSSGKKGISQYKYLGYSNNTSINLNEQELYSNINAVTMDSKGEFKEINDILKSETPNITRLKEIENHLRYQLQILETFKHIKTYSDAVNDGVNTFNTDKIGAGPTFDVTHSLSYNLRRIDNTGILEINNASAVVQIFPKFFGSTKESVYPTLEQFFIFSNLLSVNSFAKYFTGQSELYRLIKTRLNDYTTDRKYDNKLSTKINSYLNNSLLKDLPWFNDISIEERRTLIGIDTKLNLSLDLRDPNSLVEFEQLSVANQFILLHDQIKYSDNSIIKHLKVSTQEAELKRNRHYSIEYENNDVPDAISQSFNDLWYSDNVFERIFARNLVKYEYIVNGFGFGFSSFGKIIPNTIFYYGSEPYKDDIKIYNEKGIGLSEHLYGKLDVINSMVFDEENIEKDINAASHHVFNSDYKERFIKSNWKDDNIVPDASGLKYINYSIQNESGENGVPLRYFQTIKNENNEDLGIIAISAKKLENIPTSRLSKKVRERDVIKLGRTNTVTGEVKYQLFARYNNFVEVDEYGNVSGTVYYYPINKLEPSENEEESVFKDNNQYYDGSELLDPTDYVGIINTLAEKASVDSVIYPIPLPMSYTRKHGAFRDGLEMYNTTMELIRAGERTATTRYGHTNEAEKWANLKVGHYVRIEGLDEYVKVTNPLMHIDLSGLPARLEWVKKEGWDITVAHELQDEEDLFQFEYMYIGSLQDVMNDSKTTFSEEGEIDEDLSDKSTNTVENFDMSSLNIGDIINITVSGRRTSTSAFKIINLFEDSYGYSVTVESTITGNIETYMVDDNGIIDYHSDEVLAYIHLSNIKNVNDTQLDLFDDSKAVAYSSSTNQGINNAINSAIPFIERHTANYAVRAGILTGVATLKDSVQLLTDTDFRRLLVENDLATLAKGLSIILKQYDFDLNDPKTDTKKGGILARLAEFESMDMNTIINDKVIRKEFTGFIKRAISFLNGITSFEELSSINGDEFTAEEKIVNDLIKQLQGLLPEISNVKTKVDKLWRDFNESDLYQYTKNPEIVAGIRSILDAGDDENYFQLKLDALADTNNSYIALMVKKYMVNMINGEDEASKEIGKFEALLRKVFNGRNITTLTASDFDKYLEKKDGKPTGKLIQKYDWDRFYADKKAYFERIIKDYGKKTENYYRASRAWFTKNQIDNVTDEEFNAIVRKKKEDLLTNDFIEWKNRNVKEIDGEIHYLIGDSLFSIPSDKYLNPEWLAIKDDPLYQKFVEIINKYTDYFGKNTILNRGFIPSMSAQDKDNISVADKIKKWVTVHKFQKQSESFVGENNEMVYILTIPMVNHFGTQKEILIDRQKKDELDSAYERRIIQDVTASGRGNFKTLGEIRAENRKIRNANDEEHAGKIDYNLGEVFTRFIKEATTYKVKADMKHEYDLALYEIRNMRFDKRDSRNNLLINKKASKALDKSITRTMGGEGTNLEKHFSEWLEAIFYGNFDIDEGTWTTIGNMLIKFTSAKNMWFNMTAGINNVMIGKIQVKLEEFAGWYFKSKNLNKADKMYLSAIPDIIINSGSTKAGSLTNAIIKKLNVTQNTNERDYSTGMLKENLWSWSSMYLLNDIGEHYLQNVSALAMLDHHRIVNGKIMSLAEYQMMNYREALDTILDADEKIKLEAYLKARYKEEEFKESKKDYLRDFILNLPINKAKLFVEAKKKLDETTTQSFESNPKLIDAFILNSDGYAELVEEIDVDGKKVSTKLNTNEYSLFVNKAKYVVQKQQGIYNKEDAATISRTVIGKAGMQFKKHVRPGWNKRFGAKFGKSFWSESRDEWNKGAHVSLFKFLASPFSRHRAFNTDEAKEFHTMMGRILNDLYHFATNVGIYWNTLDDFEKGNVRRAIMDNIYLCSVLMVAAMLKTLKPEDDDDENFAYDLAAYEIDRLLSETMTYSPWGLVNEGQKIMKSPAAVQGTIIDTYRLMSSLVGYPFQDEDERKYRTGVYAGDTKLKVNAIKLVPVINKIQQLQRIDKFNKYYILFRG